jgi:hypothetical protein
LQFGLYSIVVIAYPTSTLLRNEIGTIVTHDRQGAIAIPTIAITGSESEGYYKACHVHSRQRSSRLINDCTADTPKERKKERKLVSVTGSKIDRHLHTLISSGAYNEVRCLIRSMFVVLVGPENKRLSYMQCTFNHTRRYQQKAKRWW